MNENPKNASGRSGEYRPAHFATGGQQGQQGAAEAPNHVAAGADSRPAVTPPLSATPSSRPVLDDMPRLEPDDGLRRVKHKRHKARKRILIALGIILVIFLAAGGAIALWLNSLDQSMSMTDEQKQELRDTLTSVDANSDNAYYVLILGSDAREGDTASRSDVTMLARIDPSNYVVDLISIPRDTMVTINGSTQKINAAYAFGGAKGAIEAVSEFAGVDISHYVEVHFSELERVVDELGGVWVDVPESFSAGNGGMSFEKGNQKLNGEQALAYARERYNVSGGDFGRAQAQRQIVEAIVKQVLASSPTQIPGLVSSLASAITTDYSIADMGKLAMDFYGKDMKMYSAACPSYSLSRGGVSYVGTMFDEWRAMMQRVDAGLDPNDETAEIPDEQKNDERLGSAANSAAPKDYESLAASAGLTTDDVASTNE